MKNSAAVPSGAAEKMRLKDLTKLMAIIFARYLASLTVYVASSQSAQLTHHSRSFGSPACPSISLNFPLARLKLGRLRSSLAATPRSFAFYVARPVRSIHHALLCRWKRGVMSSGSQAANLTLHRLLHCAS